LITIKSKIPTIYHRFLPDFFDLEVPEETIATCDNCVMARDYKQKKINNQEYYISDTKCCTYHPYIPNFLVGGLLSSNLPRLQEGKRRMIKKIGNGKGIYPMRIQPSFEYQFHYEKFSGFGFGKSKELLCPFFNQGFCSVWDFRESMCALWFCKSVGGESGTIFWNGLNNLLKQIQGELARYCLRELEMERKMPEVDFKKITSKKHFEKSYYDEYVLYWKNWQGKEIEFYKQCFEIINLTPDQELMHLLSQIFSEKLPELNKLRQKFLNQVLGSAKS